MNYRIGADIGGTFTDIVMLSGDGKTFEFGKVLTTPDAPDDAVSTGISELLARSGVDPTDVLHAVHGTTLFTNALIERRGARTALVTTKGFRDAIEIAREHRYDMYDLRLERPQPLAPRQLRFELDERILADGTVRKPLDEAEVIALAAHLRDQGIAAIAICLLNSYRNPDHEVQVAKILARELPGVALTSSSELVPEIREYDRTSTTLANVYVKKIAQDYLGRLDRRLKEEHRIQGALFIMQSNGGVCDVETAQQFPIRLVESGPAAGAIAAAHYGQLLGVKDLLSFDMGGTTAKACVIADGEPLIAPEFEVDRRYQFKKGSGFPIKVPVIEMIEIGTGGGSVATIDAMRRLRVGPRSAGAKPGPCCYGLGGAEPTVTDADLMLGYLNPDFFLGGQMNLDVQAARNAIEARVGGPLGLGLADAAWGIHELANESMASAARIHTVERGKDAEKYPIFAFGGAGPVHAYGVARILRSPQVIYPLGAGVISAVGFLAAPLSFDFVRSLPAPLQESDWAEIRSVIAEMETEGRGILSRTVPRELIRFKRFADMRYRKQGYEIRVPLPDSALDAAHAATIRETFEGVYAGLYGHTMPRAPVDVVSWRVVALGPQPELVLPKIARSAPGRAVKTSRSIYLPEAKGFAEVPVYDRYALAVGQEFAGPAVIEERESTVVINGPAQARVDEWGNLFVRMGGRTRA
jgi:N-methylhydantoinase A